MSNFPIHDRSSAPQSEAALNAAEQAFGRVPNLIGVLAESPVAAQAYLQLAKLVQDADFEPAERHVAWFAAIHENGCGYCMAAHSAMAKGDGVADEIVAAAREGGPLGDPRLEALRRFTAAVVRERGWVRGAELDAFLEAGFTRRQVLEVVTLVAMKTLSNYANHIAETPLDPAFEPFAWSGGSRV